MPQREGRLPWGAKRQPRGAKRQPRGAKRQLSGVRSVSFRACGASAPLNSGATLIWCDPDLVRPCSSHPATRQPATRRWSRLWCPRAGRVCLRHMYAPGTRTPHAGTPPKTMTRTCGGQHVRRNTPGSATRANATAGSTGVVLGTVLSMQLHNLLAASRCHPVNRFE